MTESDSRPSAEPSFAIPQRPERRYPRGGGLTYEGTTVFVLTPEATPEDTGNATKAASDADRDAWLRSLVERVLDADPYTYGDWFDLPMPVFLVHDRETSDVFRVAVRGGKVEFHVLPETDSVGLCALYERLCAATGNEAGDTIDVTWRVECRTDGEP